MIHRLSRITSFEVFCLWITAILTVMGSTTALVAIWPPFNDIRIWIYMVPDRAARIAATGAAAIGGIILGVRALVGKEPGLVEMEFR
jgi:hypothetical protein